MFLTASRIHNGKTWLPENTIIETDEKGNILSVGQGEINEKVTVLEGVLAPGFVNAHCHLELSHMKGFIPEHTGLVPFLKRIPPFRDKFTEEQKVTARHVAYDELLQNGVVAVGDICNTADALDIRSRDQLHVHSFVEALGFSEAPEPIFEQVCKVYEAYKAQPQKEKLLRQSIVPHAPYSVSQKFFHLIDKHEPEAILSIHNQECWAENQFYQSKDGLMRELLSCFNMDDTAFVPSGQTSLQTYMQWLSISHPVIFIHNTYTSREDIQAAHAFLPEVWWCLCPNANLYIEETVPQINLFVEEEADICIGTDSLTSNHQLSILAELVTIKEHFPNLSWEVLLQWGTWNGARALQMQDVVGCIEPGKQPGILQITGLDSAAQPTVKRII